MAGQRTTLRQRRGAWAEEVAVGHLRELGWRILGRNVRIGRDELDIVALEPGDVPTTVVVEVRGLHARAFGAPEERVDRRKVGVLYRAVGALRSSGHLAGERLSGARWRVDLLVVDARGEPVEVRHLRGVEPP